MSELELRCFCKKNVLLAVCGRNRETGRLFCQVKHKQGSGVAEIIVEGGPVRLRCYACSRWHTLRMRDATVNFTDEPLPQELVSIKR